MMFVLDREAYENAMYEYEETMGGESANVISLVGSKPVPTEAAAERKEPDKADFYRCGKVFPDIM